MIQKAAFAASTEEGWLSLCGSFGRFDKSAGQRGGRIVGQRGIQGCEQIRRGPAPAFSRHSRETQDGFAIEFPRRGYVVLALDQTDRGYSEAV